jgi:molecular chaperone DnaK (HSP70)
MPFFSDPIFISSVKRNSGSKRRLIQISNSDERDLEITIRDIEKPEWLEIEGIYPTQTLHFEKGKSTGFIANLNTTHKFFPKKPVKEESFKIYFEDDDVLSIQVTIAEVIVDTEPFRGVLSMDFGTTNSCFAFRGGTSPASKHLQQAKCSDVIPSVIYFHDVSDPVHPRCSIGTEAMFDIRENSARTYAYLLSAKRHLGQDRTMIMLDPFGGTKQGHQQEWQIHEMVSFIIRELLDRAEDELGQIIHQIVATFPPMFSADRKRSLRKALEKALRDRGIEVEADSVILDLDEANAAAFHYIYTDLLGEFRKFQVTEKKADLLAFDFGGGTIDIALVGVKISRTGDGKVLIETELKGLSGEESYGGDNVTLDLFRIAKWQIALSAAKQAHQEKEELRKAEEETEKKDDDIWGASTAKETSAEEELLKANPAVAQEEENGEEEVEEDPELALIVNRTASGVTESAMATVIQETETLRTAIAEGTMPADVIRATESVRDLAERRIRQLEEAVETLVPTRFSNYTDVDPHKEILARKLFHELWHEVDALKIRLSVAKGESRPIAGVLRNIAKYMGVDPILFNEINFEMAQLEKRIDGKLTAAVRKAYDLFQGASGKSTGGISISNKADMSNLRVLLFGNSSHLPAVKTKVMEIFRIPKENLIHNTEELKTAVASGACDEYGLRKAFGERGLIHYEPVGFLDKIPYAMGLYHRDLSLVGWENGFWPIFERGTGIGASKELDEKSNFLIHPDIRELAIYVDYRDGAGPKYVGFFDFTKPLEEATDQAAFEQGTEESTAKFRIRVDLLETRELTATNLTTGQKFGMVLEKEAWINNENPFAGIH